MHIAPHHNRDGTQTWGERVSCVRCVLGKPSLHICLPLSLYSWQKSEVSLFLRCTPGTLMLVTWSSALGGALLVECGDFLGLARSAASLCCSPSAHTLFRGGAPSKPQCLQTHWVCATSCSPVGARCQFMRVYSLRDMSVQDIRNKDRRLASRTLSLSLLCVGGFACECTTTRIG